MIKRKSTNIGAWVLTFLFVMLFFILMGRFIYIQTTQEVNGQVLTAIAEEKWTKERVIEAHRGRILDRNGSEIAIDVPSYTLIAILDENYSANSSEPLHVTNPRRTAELLSPHLNMDVYELEKILSKKDQFQVEFGPAGRGISYSLKEEIEKLELPGIEFIKETKRHYPNGMFASHTIGYAIQGDDGKLKGEMGIEKAYDEYLRGKNGFVTYQSDRMGYKLPDPNEMITPPSNGNDIYLTLDQKIQTFLEDAITSAYTQYEPKKIIAIVANPKTGEILAMSNRPSFDPNERQISNYMNDAISYRFEPGSTMKIFTLAAAINEGVFNPDEEYQSGSYRISEKVKPIRDHNRQGWGTITFREGVQRSSNVAFAKLANEKLGTDRLLQYLYRFKLHEKTGIHLPNEANSNLLYRYPIEKITTAFGQGSTITPIQQIQAATAIANSGKMMKPYLVKKIIDSKSGKLVEQFEPEVVGTPIEEDTAAKVLDLLESVVSSPQGTGKPYRIDGYTVAGKTGTAQIPDPEGGYKYGHGNYIFSFMGVAPKEDPQLLMYVAVKEPKLKPYQLGSEPVSLVFNTVMKNSLHYLNIEPLNKAEASIEKPKNSFQIDSFVGKSVDSMKTELASAKSEVFVFGEDSEITNHIPYPGASILPEEKVVVKTKGEMYMPDLTGWSYRDVMKVANLLELKPNLIGNGFVESQNIKPGSEVKEGDYLVVELSLPSENNMKEDVEEIDEREEEEIGPID